MNIRCQRQRLAHDHTERIMLSKHARKRMQERGVTLRQILTVLRNKNLEFSELPHLTAGGEWKITLKGTAAGEWITIALVLKELEYEPSSLVVTVWFD